MTRTQLIAEIRALRFQWRRSDAPTNQETAHA